MEKTTLVNFQKKYKNINATRRLAILLYEYNQSTQKMCCPGGSGFRRYVQKHDVEFEIPSFDETLELLHKVNLMVKDPTCPNNLKNKFYERKHKFLSRLYDHNAFDTIVEDENYFGFYIEGYCFHQRKDWFQKEIKVDSYEKYEKRENSIPFDKTVYTQCLIGIILYMVEEKYGVKF